MESADVQEQNINDEGISSADENEDLTKLQLNISFDIHEEQQEVEGEISTIRGSIRNQHDQELNLTIKVNYNKDFALLEVSPNTLKLGPKGTTDIEIKHSLLQEGGVLLLKCFDSTNNKFIAFRVCKEKDKTDTERSTTEKENGVTLWDKNTECEGEKGGYTDRAHGDEYQLIVLMYILLLAQKAKQCFKLACEFKKAGKFDDIYLQFWKNCTHYFLQLKHRLTEAKDENSKRAIVFEVDQLKKSKKKKKDEEETTEKPVNVDGDTYSLSGKNLNLIELCKSYEQIIEIDEVQSAKSITCMLFTNNETAVNQKKEKLSINSIDDSTFELPELLNHKSQILDDQNIINELKNHFENQTLVTKFIQNFHLAFNQLPAYEIKSRAKKLIYDITGSKNDIIYYHLRGSIDEWMKDKKISYVTDNSFNNLFNSISRCRCINTVRHEMTEPIIENFEDKIGLKEIVNGKEAIINIHGDVDSGKTDAALKLLNLIIGSENEKSTIWINANSQCAIETSFLEVAALLGITTEKDKNGTESRNFVQIINEIYLRLNQMRTIFVFSNVNTELDINEYLSPFTNNTIILTSRKCLKNLVKRKLYDKQLEVNKNDYKSYIQQKLLIPVTDNEVQQLRSKYNQSVIKLVTAYVKTVRNDQESYTLTDFQHDLEGSGKKLGDFIKDKITENHGDTAKQILNMLCYVGQNSVPSAIFNPLENCKECLDTLRKYNLVSITDNDFISVHEKIQELFAAADDKNSLNTLLNLMHEHFNTNPEPAKRNECIALTHHLLQIAQKEKNDLKIEHLSTFTNLAKVVLQSRCLEDGTSLEILREYETYLEQNSYPIDVNLKQLKALQNIRCKKFDEALQICSELFMEVNDISHLETIMPLKITTLKKMGKIRKALKEARFWYEKCSSELGSNTESTKEALQMIRNCQDTNNDGIKSLRTVIQNHKRNVETEEMLLSMVTSEIGASEVFPENIEDVLQALQVLLDVTKQLLGDFNVLYVFIQMVRVKYLLQHDVKKAEKILRTVTNIKKVTDKYLLNYQLDKIIGNVYDLFTRISVAMNAAYKNCDPLTKLKDLLRNCSIFACSEIVEKLDEAKILEIETTKTMIDKAHFLKLCDDIIGNLPILLINDPALLKIIRWKAEVLTSKEAFPIWWNLYENTKNMEDWKPLDYLKFMGDYALNQDSTSFAFRMWLKLIVNDFSHKDEVVINNLLSSVIRKIRRPTDPTSKKTFCIFFSHLDSIISITKDCSGKLKMRYQMLKELKFLGNM